jgi:3,4-dihydroxy 2-butanone 4-phosphate synthase/GTP cyclohydrolase II
MSPGFAGVEEAVEELRRGRMIVVCDDADRENEGDLVMAAQFATPAAVNFMAKEGRGLICLALTAERCERLGLELMATHGEAPLGTAFTETIGAAGGGSGTSAQARARTIQAAVAPDAGPADIVVPGHISPLRAREGGVLARAGHTEASVDLARLAGLTPAGVICEVMAEDGSMARLPDLVPYCERHGLKMITVADLIAYRRRTEKLVERVVETALPTAFGEFRAVGYRALLDDSHHLAMVKGEVAGRDDVLVRLHAACLTGDVFHGITCDCHARLEESMELIEREGEGVLVYLSRSGHELDALLAGPGGRGAGHDRRDHDLGLQILADLGVGAHTVVTDERRVGGVLID